MSDSAAHRPRPTRNATTRRYDHVVLISIDTLRADGIAATPTNLWRQKYGLQREFETPLLDELAREGAFFTNCITAAPYTTASHASIFTGRWPLRHGVYEYFNRKLTAPTLFARARGLGFSTALCVDFPIMLGPWLGFTKGVDHYLVEEEERLLDLISSSDATVSCAHFGALHIPYGFHTLKFGGAAYRAKVDALEERYPQKSGPPEDQVGETFRDDEDVQLLLRYKRVVGSLYEAERFAELFDLYLEGVTHFLSGRFGRFFERLRDCLAGTRHLVVVFGDHGEEYDADSYGHFNSVSEGVLRVPLVVWGTDVRPGMWRDRIRTIDIAPTVLDLIGDRGSRRLRMDGSSLADTVLTGADYPVRHAIAQVYNADIAPLHRFQQRVVATGRKTGQLRHVLFREAVYDGDLKLSRENFQRERLQGGAITPVRRVELERIAGDAAPTPAGPEADGAALEKLLADYNAIRGSGRKVDVPEELRKQFDLLGYRI